MKSESVKKEELSKRRFTCKIILFWLIVQTSNRQRLQIIFYKNNCVRIYIGYLYCFVISNLMGLLNELETRRYAINVSKGFQQYFKLTLEGDMLYLSKRAFNKSFRLWLLNKCYLITLLNMFTRRIFKEVLPKIPFNSKIFWHIICLMIR